MKIEDYALAGLCNDVGLLAEEYGPAAAREKPAEQRAEKKAA